jgi:AraC-like DNA-binding protein
MPTNTAAHVDSSQLAANDILFGTASRRRTQRMSLVLWLGDQAISIGMGQSLTLHRHYATQISISLGAPLHVRTRASGPYTEQQSFIVGPNIPHQVETLGIPSFVLWSEARALADLARHLSTTSISRSRFRLLFRSEMGMSVQSYLRWQRLLIALGTSVHGASLTETAHAAEFADSAHLMRIIHATFGMPPSDIFKNSHTVQVIAGDSVLK